VGLNIDNIPCIVIIKLVCKIKLLVYPFLHVIHEISKKKLN
jgi:hypothetical protein